MTRDELRRRSPEDGKGARQQEDGEEVLSQKVSMSVLEASPPGGVESHTK